MTRVKVVKNKVARAVPGGGVRDHVRAGHLTRGRDHRARQLAGDHLKSRAPWYAYKGSRIGQGKDNARTYLLANKEVAREIEEQVRAKLLPPRAQRNVEPAANTA